MNDDHAAMTGTSASGLKELLLSRSSSPHSKANGALALASGDLQPGGRRRKEEGEMAAASTAEPHRVHHPPAAHSSPSRCTCLGLGEAAQEESGGSLAAGQAILAVAPLVCTQAGGQVRRTIQGGCTRTAFAGGLQPTIPKPQRSHSSRAAAAKLTAGPPLVGNDGARALADAVGHHAAGQKGTRDGREGTSGTGRKGVL